MNRRSLLKNLSLSVPAFMLAQKGEARSFIDQLAGAENMADGKFQPTWESLQQYKVPEWYSQAKFGMWAHWGPQCQPEAGDWYAREMYMEGSGKYKFHLQKYGHPSVFGFKDVINEWKADKWDPEELVALYKKTGAQYFVAMASHHDNLDLFNSRYQPNWNSTKVGPKKDIIGGWAKAAKRQGLPFGVSIHAAHAWSWFETSQRWDKNGPKAGVPYDGKLTKADGKGKWWNGLDPQELYAQNHALSENSWDNGMIHRQWNWGNGVTPPTTQYIEKFYNRTIDLINKYKPDVLYFDDSQLPFWPVNDAGLRIAAHHYNTSIKNHGELKAVINGKILNEEQRKALVWDIERGQSNNIEPFVWQTDTCIGNWHYDRALYNRNGYKSADTVIKTLVDIVSKNGNLLLNIPVRGDGSIDEKERAIVEGIGEWMAVNSESIYETKPWKIFGEGPAQQASAALSAQGFNEGKGKPFTAEDIRFATKNNKLFATLLGKPVESRIVIKTLSAASQYHPAEIQKVSLLKDNVSLDFKRTTEGLIVQLPGGVEMNHIANVLVIA